MKDTTLQTQEAYQTPSRNIRKPYKHILENRNKGKILKALNNNNNKTPQKHTIWGKTMT